MSQKYTHKPSSSTTLVANAAAASAVAFGAHRLGNYLTRESAGKQHVADSLRQAADGSNVVRNVGIGLAVAAGVALLTKAFGDGDKKDKA